LGGGRQHLPVRAAPKCNRAGGRAGTTYDRNVAQKVRGGWEIRTYRSMRNAGYDFVAPRAGSTCPYSPNIFP
jgi:hypothetical protein